MKLTPVLTEKSLNDAKNGFYTFWVSPGMRKSDIKKAIENTFEVHVTKIQTINYKPLERKNMRGYKVSEKKAKKAVVALKGDEKIDLFEEKSGKA